ncbi:MAG TPA: DMT family transporter, partial [Anaerolineales bacterium]|nr:DMT family transporter [Anaerolineales bacterium]
MDHKAFPYLSLLGVLFGTSLVASRFSVGQFPPEMYIGLRLLLAGLGFAAWYTFRLGGRAWPRSPAVWKHGAVIGLIGSAIPMVAITTALQHQSSGLTSILLTAEPALTITLAHFLLPDERLNGRKIAGVLLAMGGAVLLIALGESGLPNIRQASPLGYGLILLAMLSGSGMSIYV